MIKINDKRITITAGPTRRKNDKVKKPQLNRLIKSLLKADEIAKSMGAGLQISDNGIEIWVNGTLHAGVKLKTRI